MSEVRSGKQGKLKVLKTGRMSASGPNLPNPPGKETKKEAAKKPTQTNHIGFVPKSKLREMDDHDLLKVALSSKDRSTASNAVAIARSRPSLANNQFVMRKAEEAEAAQRAMLSDVERRRREELLEASKHLKPLDGFPNHDDQFHNVTFQWKDAFNNVRSYTVYDVFGSTQEVVGKAYQKARQESDVSNAFNVYVRPIQNVRHASELN